MLSEQTLRLIRKYDLTKEVDAFVAERLRASAGRTAFHFRGTCRACGPGDPHLPHVHDGYHTVRYGRLEVFCLGVSGDGLEVVVEAFAAGSADTPGVARGYTLHPGAAE